MSAFRSTPSAPANYVAGRGRGAAGFTTRSDVGPAAPASMAGDSSGNGSRASEARNSSMPANYVPGAGRGAARLSKDGDANAGSGAYDAFGGYANTNTGNGSGENGQYDDDDNEADQMWAAIDERMRQKRKRSRKNDNDEKEDEDDGDAKQSRVRQIGVQFRELKEKLADVTEDQWAAIPDVGDYSLKYKQKRRQQEAFTPMTDSLLEQRSKANLDATSGNATLGANTQVTADDNNNSGTVTNMSGLSAARGTVLGMSLDKMSDTTNNTTNNIVTSGTQTSVDPTGYLTSLSSTKIATATEIGDLAKARLLLKSVRDTNPHHAPGWIASARVEEAGGHTLQARKLIQQGCDSCPDNPDVWLEAARLHPNHVGRSILATAVRRIPTSVPLFLKAADLEHTTAARTAVLRKALEANPTSVTLWKAAIELEDDAEDARILLSVAVEQVPQAVELWLALARLESYETARAVLNRARKALPTDRSIWMAAAQLEESQPGQDDAVDRVVQRAVQSLSSTTTISRTQWIQEADAAEAAGAPVTAAAVVRHTIGLGVEEEDRWRTWTQDAREAVQRGSLATARAILSRALDTFPTKRSVWWQSVELERAHGTAEQLDSVLCAASERLPRTEIFWLLRAKNKWSAGDVDGARQILTQAFAANPDSEDVWLAAAKLEWENKEIERARVLLARARERAATDRVYMKSALLEREEGNFGEAIQLIEQGIGMYSKFAKLYMMGGQICSDDLPKQKSSLDRARKFYQRGLEQCPDNTTLWILTSRLEERVATFDSDQSAKVGSTKARSLLELARLKVPKSPDLWLEAVRLERRSNNAKLAETLMAKALQECPTSGSLLSENIMTAPRVEQKSKSADAIKKSPDDPRVIYAVASLFAAERKNEKARKWFDRAVLLNPDYGDSWARYYAFECAVGTEVHQENVKERCTQAEPKHGEIWTCIMKDVKHRSLSISDGLKLAAAEVEKRKNTALIL